MEREGAAEAEKNEANSGRCTAVGRWLEGWRNLCNEPDVGSGAPQHERRRLESGRLPAIARLLAPMAESVNKGVCNWREGEGDHGWHG